MKSIGFFKADTLVNLVNWIGIPFFFLYVICMAVAPWFQGGRDWAHVQNVWDRWQTLNAGILAFIASVIALNISKYRVNKQRERQFISARAFLPHALSELITYYKQSAKLFLEVWPCLEKRDERPPFPLASVVPELPESYKETFSRCIEQAEPDVGDYLAMILVQLQVHHARMKDLYASLTQPSHLVVVRANVMSYMYRLAQLQVLVEKIFPFARGTEKFENSSPVWDDYRNAYGNLDISPEDFDDLVGFTKRAIERSERKQG